MTACRALHHRRRSSLPINIAVINNGFLGMVRQWQEAFYDKNYCRLAPSFQP